MRVRRPAARDPRRCTRGQLLWEAIGVGVAGTHFRVYVDSDSLWFTLNASWNGSAWARDSTSWFCGGFRFSRSDFEFLHEDTFAATFTTWNRTWILPFRGTPNSAFVTTGAIEEIGRCGIESHNTYNATRNMAVGATTSLRELQRLLRDLDHEKQTAVQQAWLQPWRRS